MDESWMNIHELAMMVNLGINDEFQLQLELQNITFCLVVTINSMIISLDRLTGGIKLVGEIQPLFRGW